MKKRISVIGTGIGALALAATIGISGLFSATSSAAEPSGTDQEKSGKETRQNPMQSLGLTEAQMEAINAAKEAQVKSALAALVSAGTITQEQADSMTAVKTKNKTGLELSDTQKTALAAARETANSAAMTELVSAGTLTQEQADAIGSHKSHDRTKADLGFTKEQMTALKAATEENTKTAIAALVSAGTITQEQADAFADMKNGGKTGQNEKPSKPDMTEAQMSAVMTALNSARSDAAKSLVAAGTITQEQADKLNTPKAAKKPELAGITKEQMETVANTVEKHMKSELDKLVKDGTFTQEVADKLATLCVKTKPATSKFTDAQKTAVRTALESANKAALASLVSAGTITQEQADKLAAMPQGFGDKGGKMGLGGHGGPGGSGGTDGMSFEFKGPGKYHGEKFTIEPQSESD